MRIGLCTGVFDVFHRGHQHFLVACMARCDRLIIAVNHDRWVSQRKGEGRPMDSLAIRMEAVEEFCGQRASVIPFNGESVRLADAIEPDMRFLGYDQVIEGTIPTYRVDELEGFSSTSIANTRRAFK